jgi:hypothetical protein
MAEAAISAAFITAADFTAAASAFADADAIAEA